MDKKIVAEIDQKVIDQQNTLEKAGVPGFYITTNAQVNFLLTVVEMLAAQIILLSIIRAIVIQTKFQQVAVCVLTSALQLIFQELTMQMNLLELILKLQQKESQSGIP